MTSLPCSELTYEQNTKFTKWHGKMTNNEQQHGAIMFDIRLCYLFEVLHNSCLNNNALLPRPRRRYQKANLI